MIDHSLLLGKLSQSIRMFYHAKPTYATLIVNLLHATIGAQHTCFEGRIFKAIKGVGTGISCGVMLANILLDFYDLYITDSLDLPFYCRLVDDMLCIVRVSDTNRLLEITNTWHDCIKTEPNAPPGLMATYLDLNIDMSCVGTSDFSPVFRLFRKPLNTYMYLPRSSCHPESVFSSIIFSEATRILRRCSLYCDVCREMEFFKSKLLSKGYSIQEMTPVISAAKLAHSRALGAIPASGLTWKPRKAFLKVTHSSTVNYGALNRILRRNSGLIGKTSQIMIAKKIQRSIFRILYPYMWCGTAHRARGGWE
jgi:hypothetical protein